MKTLYLLRHGETFFNSLNKSQGWCDSPLTEKGMEQARIAKDYFVRHNIGFRKAYSSDLGRARHTLRIISEDFIDSMEEHEGLREINFGIFEGESRTFKPHKPYCDKLVPYGGESITQAIGRFSGALKEIMDKSEYENVLVVAHGSINSEFIKYCIGESITKLGINLSNGSLLKFSYVDGKFEFEEHLDCLR